jgi:hypothetical protein
MKLVHLLLLSSALLNINAYAETPLNSQVSSGDYLLAQNITRDPVRDGLDSREVRNNRDIKRRDDQSNKTSGPIAKTGLQECAGEFALCAASTCVKTGRQIEVKEDGGKTTKKYPEVICTCPIITKEIAFKNGSELKGIAAVNEGNMNGSCRVPAPDKIWSLFYPLSDYPQESTTPKFQSRQFNQQSCSARSATGSNCFSFLCTRDKELTNGVRTATCACPAGENPFGAPTQNSEFLTAAGAYYDQAKGGPQAACSQFPVSIPNITDLSK